MRDVHCAALGIEVFSLNGWNGILHQILALPYCRTTNSIHTGIAAKKGELCRLRSFSICLHNELRVEITISPQKCQQRFILLTYISFVEQNMAYDVPCDW